MIYTAPCVMFLMRADTLRGQVGEGWALEMESFLGPVNWHRADRRVPFGAQKTRGIKYYDASARLIFGSHETSPIIWSWIGKPAPAIQCELGVER
jgi:hypothetical protein